MITENDTTFEKAFKSVPNWLTLFGFFTGFLSILMTCYGSHQAAAWLILLAFLWDSMDGNIARAFGRPTALGAQLDSLADLVSFIVAPAVLVTHFFFTHIPIFYTAAVFFYLMTGVYRLARFNLSPNQGIFFKGLPTSAAGFSLAAFTLVCIKNQEASVALCLREAVALMIVLSVLMASRIPYAKASSLAFKRWRVFLGLDLFTGAVAGFIFNTPTGFLAFALFFVFLAPLYCLVNRHAFSSEREYISPHTKEACA